MTERTIKNESDRLYELWKQVPIGTAKGWFVLGALWALTWSRHGAPARPSKFAGDNKWACDDRLERRR